MNIIYGCILVGAGFCLLWLGGYVWAWHSNGVYGTKYDLQAWVTMAKEIKEFVLAVLVNHSLLNTDIPWLQNLVNKVKEVVKHD